MPPWKATFAIIFSIVCHIPLALTSKIVFLAPTFDVYPTAANGLPYFYAGQTITIAWSTLFENTTLTLIQNLADGTVLFKLLAVDWPNTQTTKTWNAEPVGNHSIIGSQFYFFLQNGKDEYCDSCNMTSTYFEIHSQNPSSSSSSTTTSSLSTKLVPKPTSMRTTSRTTSTSTSTSTPTKIAVSTQSAAPVSGNIVSHSSRPQSGGNLSTQLGVGVGAGIPAVGALAFILLLYCCHRRKKQEPGFDDQIAPERSASTDNLAPAVEQSQMRERERDSHLSRESGALGPYAQNPSPTWEQQEEREEAEQQQQHFRRPRHRRGSSARQLPFRPSLGAHSEASDESSVHSWINEFDFERPGYQDSDEMSQVQRSIRNAPSSERMHYSAGWPSRSSIMDVADIPQMPPPLFHWPPDPHAYRRY